MVMKLLDFLQLPIAQLLRSFNEIFQREGDNILGLTLEKSQILESQSL